jgi:hypothetical protein
MHRQTQVALLPAGFLAEVHTLPLRMLAFNDRHVSTMIASDARRFAIA